MGFSLLKALSISRWLLVALHLCLEAAAPGRRQSPWRSGAAKEKKKQNSPPVGSKDFVGALRPPLLRQKLKGARQKILAREDRLIPEIPASKDVV